MTFRSLELEPICLEATVVNNRANPSGQCFVCFVSALY